MKKLSFSNIKEYIEGEEGNNCKLLSTKYVNTDSLLNIKCKCGNEFETTFYKFVHRNKKQCNKCGRNSAKIKLRKTHEKFKKEVFDLVGDEFTIIGKYTNTHTKLLMRHNCQNCNNYEFQMSPHDFLEGYRCPKCSQRIKKTSEDYKKEVFDLVENEFMVIGEYIGANNKIEMVHNICNTKFYPRPVDFLYKSSRCPHCSGNERITDKMYKERIKKLFGDEYILLNNYIDMKTNIKVKHICGNIYNVSPFYLLYNQIQCPKCLHEKRLNLTKKSIEQFKKEIQEKYNGEYKVLGEYTNSKEKILVKHEVCNYEWEIVPNNLLQKPICPKCNKKIYKNTEYFIQEIFELTCGEYDVLGEYINSKTPIKMRHNCDKCGNYEFEITPNNFINQGQRCSVCGNKSKGEDTIRYYLIKNKIEFKNQYKINECKDKKALPFDFAIFIKESDTILIEYDGIQHFESVTFNGISEDKAKELLFYTKYHDQLKSDYCKLHNIKLIRIPYWDFDNIEKILDKELQINSQNNNKIIKKDLKEVI